MHILGNIEKMEFHSLDSFLLCFCGLSDLSTTMATLFDRFVVALKHTESARKRNRHRCHVAAGPEGSGGEVGSAM